MKGRTYLKASCTVHKQRVKGSYIDGAVWLSVKNSTNQEDSKDYCCAKLQAYALGCRKSTAVPPLRLWDFMICWKVNFSFYCLSFAHNICTADEWLLSCSTSHFAQVYVLLLYSHQSATHSKISKEISWQLISSYPAG
jgi:hypothetical protein